jgi:hypothetical protein
MGFIESNYDLWKDAGMIIEESDRSIAAHSITPATPGSFVVYSKEGKGCWRYLPSENRNDMIDIGTVAERRVMEELHAYPDSLFRLYDRMESLVLPNVPSSVRESSLLYLNQARSGELHMHDVPYGFHLVDNGDKKETGLMLSVPHFHMIAHNDTEKKGVVTAMNRYYSGDSREGLD